MRNSTIHFVLALVVASAVIFGFSWHATAQDESTATAPKDAILILDASGSMWGQIDGINKIVIAKDVVEGLVRGMPENQRFGMVAYGHRKKGDCSDIETIADVGADRGDVIKQIRALSPKGKTPLSKSVEHSARELDYTKKAATVILVSDGLETCDADPCELAKTLEENGLDFTVHVVGFDVTEEERKGLVCIAEETGGMFLAADNADELAGALTQVALADAEPIAGEPVASPQTVALKATILKGGPDIQRDLNWIVVDKETGETVFEKMNTGYIDFEVVPGDYTATAVWTGWPHEGDRYKGEKTGTRDFTIAAAPTVVTVPIDLGIPVTFDADSQTAEGLPVNVSWSGPDDLGTTVSVTALDDGPRDKIYFIPGQRARDEFQKEASTDGKQIDSNGDDKFDQSDTAETQIGGPSMAGDYEVRYTLSSPLVILARKPLTVTDSQYTLKVPPSVDASTDFEVAWNGPLTPGDFLTIIEKDSETTFSNGHTARLVEGEPAVLTAFAEPGDYEVRYILANGYTTYAGMQHAVQATVPVQIADVKAAISAPKTAVGGSTINVQIDTPGENWGDDILSVVEIGAVKTNSDARGALQRFRQDDGSFQIRVPAKAGDYELAYFLNPGARVIARETLNITQAQASIDAPDTVKANTDFDISYVGDAFHGDRVIVCPADTPDNKMWGWSANYGFVAKAGEAVGTVKGGYKATAKPGDYEARYVTGLQHIVLARDKFTVTE